MNYLLEKGADINASNDIHLTPFFAAVGSKQKDVAEVKLIKRYYRQLSSSSTSYSITSLCISFNFVRRWWFEHNVILGHSKYFLAIN